MEFSFDRSTKSAKAESSSPAPNDDSDTSSISNERLRKAIEKNRARQAERNQNQNQNHQQASPRVPPTKPRAEEREHTNIPKEEILVTRKSVARAEEAEFVPVKRTPRKATSQISYTTTSARKKNKTMDPAITGYLIKGSWIFCVAMILRLIFANGGVSDFYSQRSFYSNRLTELDRIKKENMQIVQEIERMQTDSAFQKKLVRDNLGFIAADEFLVLFPKENSVQ